MGQGISLFKRKSQEIKVAEVTEVKAAAATEVKAAELKVAEVTEADPCDCTPACELCNEKHTEENCCICAQHSS